ncbi:hypothetical protein EDC04DRAFT_2900155 [Pisolithus marmoratus]|nr:hypothetical protein EDC04DRAFT_2900155 [Pisolithus marmoratus]
MFAIPMTMTLYRTTIVLMTAYVAVMFGPTTPKSKDSKSLPQKSPEAKTAVAARTQACHSDQLTFRADDEITFVNEDLEDWWLGILKVGRKGLFPMNFTTPIAISSQNTNRDGNGSHFGSGSSLAYSVDIEDDESINYLVPGNLMVTRLSDQFWLRCAQA